MKQLFFSLLMALLPMAAKAASVEINGIYYNLITKTKVAEVTKHPSKYTGSVTIPESVTHDGVEYSVKSIGENAFFNCTELTSVNIPNSVTSIEQNAFSTCRALTSVSIPNSVTSIGLCAFQDCRSLTSVTIPNSVTSIGGFAFNSCISLTTISIPNTVTTIGGSAFRDCTKLTSVTIPNSIGEIESSTFSGCSSLTTVSIPSTVTTIGTAAFRQCTSLTSVAIPNSVQTISAGAFEGCSSLESITVGSGVSDIKTSAFAQCREMKDFYCLAENEPNTNSYAFEGSYIEYTTLHVPTNSISAYKQAEPWKSFNTIVSLDGSVPTTPKCAKPSITYQNGQLKMTSSTEGATFVTEITDMDIKKHYDATISLAATYNVSVYATKVGYEDSDISSLTLCWIEHTPAISTGTVQVPAMPIIIHNDGGSLMIQGADDGTTVSIFNINGTMIGTTTSQSGEAVLDTTLKTGSTVIIKIGQKSLKFMVK